MAKNTIYGTKHFLNIFPVQINFKPPWKSTWSEVIIAKSFLCVVPLHPLRHPGCCLCPHFLDEETEDWVIYLKTHSLQVRRARSRTQGQPSLILSSVIIVHSRGDVCGATDVWRDRSGRRLPLVMITCPVAAHRYPGDETRALCPMRAGPLPGLFPITLRRCLVNVGWVPR